MKDFNSQNSNNYELHLGRRVWDISEATLPNTLENIERYRSQGILDSEMGLLKDYEDCPEKIILRKSWLFRMAREMGGVNVIAALRGGNINLTLEEELEILLACPGQGLDEIEERLTVVNRIRQNMTLSDLRLMRQEAAATPGVCEELGTKEFQEYIDAEVRSLAKRFGWGTKLDDAVMNEDIHATALTFNALSIGEATFESLNELREIFRQAFNK